MFYGGGFQILDWQEYIECKNEYQYIYGYNENWFNGFCQLFEVVIYFFIVEIGDVVEYVVY